MDDNEYPGSCYCGSIGFRFLTAIAPSDWSVRACQCRFCVTHDAQSTSDPSGQLHFTARDPQNLQRFRFGLRTADFLLCRNCGVYIGAVIEIDGARYGILNTHALDATPESIAGVAPIDYDGEDTSGRIARREERWTPVATVPW